MSYNILVTGCCGFIGSNFVKYWRNHFPDDVIVGIDSLTYAANTDWTADDLDYLEVADILDKDEVFAIFEEFKPDFVFHFAAESHVCRSIDGPDQFVFTNIVGTFHLLEAFRKTNGKSGRFIHISTDEVFGQLKLTDQPFHEKSNILPRSPYAATKAASDLLALSYFETYGTPVIVTNCSNNFGRFQHEEKLIPATIKRIMRGEPARLYGNGSQLRDWLFVEDHCSALFMAALNGIPGERYCIGGDKNITNREMIEIIFHLMQKNGLTDRGNLEIEFTNDRPTDDFRYAIDSQKLKNLGWELSSKSFEEKLLDTIKWHVENFRGKK